MFKKSDPVPYHLQIKDVLKREILDDVYTEKIPSENDLIDRFSVSRTTIREAINHLVNEGRLKKVHGKGTFVTKTKPVHDWIHSIKSLTDTITKMGMSPGSRLLKNKRISEPEYISDLLGVEVCHLIKRLRTADGIPIAIERHYYDTELGDRLNHFDLNSITIYDVLENDLGLHMAEAEQSITCRPVNDEDAKELDVEPGTNVLVVDRLIRDANGHAIEYYTSLIKPEMYVFRFTLRNQGGGQTAN